MPVQPSALAARFTLSQALACAVAMPDRSRKLT
jgi:hypothetical protein